MVLERRADQAERTVVAVGLTGSIGAGKSTALSMFADRGAVVFSADEIVHELYRRPEVIQSVAGHLGQRMLGDDGSIDRARLAAAVRGNAEGLRWLEQLTHPLVAGEIERRIEAAESGRVVVCEVPLMFETGFQRLFDLVITIEAGPEVRRGRSTHKFGLEQLAEFEALQASRQKRTAGSDMVYVNDGALEGLSAFVGEVFENARAMLAPGYGRDEQ